MKIKFTFWSLCLLVVALQSCTNNALTDVFTSIPNQHWTYAQPCKSNLEIIDIHKKYNILINLRHTDDYRYSNIWFKISIIQPNKHKKTERIAFSIASPDGTWLGNTSGSLFTYQLPYKLNYNFAAKGKYTIVVEQNMRDNPLNGINDVGIRVEEVEEK
ncbi:MAG: gliding motility lipoprotein GldH [Sphingobacteriales bacterium]|nr:MAG: gliding motility lipoprotein GldH [Sphingobacteriales bacterium]TAF82688.1 MAG: gliding motility lipoprotein GldH [Sphingobacteriales bacterium]